MVQTQLASFAAYDSSRPYFQHPNRHLLETPDAEQMAGVRCIDSVRAGDTGARYIVRFRAETATTWKQPASIRCVGNWFARRGRGGGPFWERRLGLPARWIWR